MNELQELGNKFGTDKQTFHNYTPFYFQHFAPIKERPLRILEIGVYHGASVKMWKEFFPNAEIIGADIDPKCKQYTEERIHIRIGDQGDKDFLLSLAADFGPFDIVIDDGGHRMTQQIISFETLFDYLNPGGIYVIEDLQTSYLTQFGGGGADSTVNYLKNMIDELNHQRGLAAGLAFYPKICFIFKQNIG